MRTHPGRNARGGFNLVEVLVVLAVLGLIVGLLLPAVQSVRTAAGRLSCQNRMKQLGLALHSYHDAFGRLPRPGAVNGYERLQEVTWLTRLLPFVEQQALWDVSEQALRADRNPYHSPPHTPLATVVPVYTCPADGRVRSAVSTPGGRSVALTSYVGVGGAGAARPRVTRAGIFPDLSGMFGTAEGVRFADVTDGLSNTLMVGERPPGPDFDNGWWYVPSRSYDLPAPVLGMTEPVGYQRWWCNPPMFADPTRPGFPIGYFAFGPGRFDNPCDSYHFWSPHVDGANFAIGDGSVRFIRYAARDVMPDLATRNGGEPASVPE